jgi:hypothetical protein
MLTEELKQSAEILFVNPIEHKPVWGIDTQLVAFGFNLKRTDPGVELLGRQLVT